MELKQKWRRFWTLNRHHEDGFTLIELVVTIAILAILAGAGTGVYSGYIQASNKGNDKVLVGNVMRALETAAYSYTADFAVEGQYSTGLQIPVGHVVLTTEGIEAVSNDAENDPIGKALAAAMGDNYSTAYKLSYDKWETGAIGGNLHNATGTMMEKLNSNASILISLEKIASGWPFNMDLGLVKGDYDNANELILGVSSNIAAMGEENFLNAWMGATSVPHDQAGFGLSNREDYTAVRTAYNNSFAEYVRANYSGDKDADTLADGIANYGVPAGDLIASKVGNNQALAKALNKVIGGTTFANTVNKDAFKNDEYFIGYKDEDIEALYDEWLKTSAANDAAIFYNTMVTASAEGEKYLQENKKGNLADWISSEAQKYSDSMSAVQGKVSGKSAIVVTAYYQNGLMNFDVYSPEADPRND